MGVVFVLKDPVRSFWISTLDWRIFGVFLFRKDFVIFFLSNHFWDFQTRISFFPFLAYFFLFVFSFPPRAGKQGIMGPGFI